MPKDRPEQAHGAVGRQKARHGAVTSAQADMLGATLVPGWTVGTLPDGAPVPKLWHWAAFPPAAPMEDLGPDGHPKLGDFLPDLGLNRRMWAGGSLRFLRPIHVGERLTRLSEIASVDHKDTAGGPMAFVTLRHRIDGAAGPAIEEDQTIVYLQIPPEFRPPKAIPAPEAPAFERTLPVTAPLLFRYSAATFNAHRIHYDRAYATGVEHYPGLVVHGPLQATLLMAAATAHRGSPPDSFQFRGLYPMFDHHDLRLIGVDKPDGTLALCTAAPAGHQGMQATAAWS
ncbi:FAS1-like dehydratase domain-containing protein [Meridianimarinicoccus zhengii]|uniref:FAS1-like dehydratase domain-containing protein n=1 Tax=Meridianimarinicoccus zhengii TaxID=2056810 RepID=UPI000DAEA052|nr:MaoC family dehydratase N-terminal domain-containing protein [Phycocomes zhengii]